MADNPNLDRLIQALTKPTQQPQKPKGVRASDYLKELAGGAVQGVGYGVRGVGDIINSPRYAYGNRSSRDVLIDATPLKKAGMWIAGKGDDAAQSVSPSAQEAIAGSQPEGELLHPSTWSLGKDPSVSGYALQAANVLGQVAPVVATGAVTRGRVIPSAGVAASLGGGAAGAQEEERIEQMPQAELNKVQGYRDLVAGGMSPSDARKALADRTGSRAALTTAPVSALSAFTEALPVAGVGQKTLSKLVGTSRLARAGTGALLDAGAEGVQEAAEQAAQTAGANAGTGEDRSLGTDTFQNAVLGALGGTVPGAIGGLAHGVEGGEPASSPAQAPAPGAQQPAEASAPAQVTPEQSAPVVTGVQPGFKPGVNPQSGRVEVAPGVEVDESAGPLQRSLVEGAAEGSLDQPAAIHLDDGSAVNPDTGEVVTPPTTPAPAPTANQRTPQPPQAPAPSSAAQVPFMLTAAMRRGLVERGYDRRSISRMTPDEAQAILAQPAPANNEGPAQPATDDDIAAAIEQFRSEHAVVDAKANGMLARRLGVSRQRIVNVKRRMAEDAIAKRSNDTASEPVPEQPTLDLAPQRGTENGEEAPEKAAAEEAPAVPEKARGSNEEPKREAPDDGEPDTSNAPGANIEAGKRDSGPEPSADTGHAAGVNVEAGERSVSPGADEPNAEAIGQPVAPEPVQAPKPEPVPEAQRSSNAAGDGPSPFVQNLMDLGDLTRDQAETAHETMRKAGMLTTSSSGPGVERVKHGAFLDRDVIRRAAGIEDRRQAPTTAQMTDEERFNHLKDKPIQDLSKADDDFLAEYRSRQETRATKAPATEAVESVAGPVKWFGSRDKADAFITRKKMGGTHEVVQNGRRFEVREKEQAEPAAQDAASAPSSQAEAKAQPTVTEQIKRAKQRLFQARRKGTDTTPIEAEIRRLRSHAFDDQAPAADQNDKAPTTADGIERGAIGGKYKSGQKLKTSSGRTTSPFPLVNTGTDRRTKATIKRVHKWLMQNALDEAKSRGDEFNARQFEANLEKPSQADRDSAEEYLFGQQPKVAPDVTKPLAAGRQDAEAAPEAPTSQGEKINIGNSEAPESPADEIRRHLEAAPQVDHLTKSQLDEVSAILDRGEVNRGERKSAPSAKPKPAKVAADNATRGVNELGRAWVSNKAIQAVKDRFAGMEVNSLSMGDQDGKTYFNGIEPDGRYTVESKDKVVTFDGKGTVTIYDHGSDNDSTAKYDPSADYVDEISRVLREAGAKPRNDRPGAKKNPVSKKKPAPKANTIFTEEAAERARAVLRRKLGNLNTGIDPEVLQAGIELAGYHIERGARTFAAYAKAMVDDMGEGVKAYLKSWYMGIKYDPRASQLDGLDSAAVVEAADVDALTSEPAEEANTNEHADAEGDGAGTLGQVPAGENEAAQGTENVGGGDAERGAGRPGRNQQPDGARVSGTRSRGSRTSKARDAEARARSGHPRPGEARVGGDGSGVQENPAGVTPPATTIPANDFTITGDVELGKGGEVTKFNDNIAAIQIVKALEAENRRATPEEQAKLARYVGWGGLASAFKRPNGSYANGWQARADQLAGLLTPKELAAARRSTRNAHYTSETVVRGMWSALERIGFKGGIMLEPSMGTGNFIGMRPDSLRNTKFVGVELDPLTARIASALYPSETVLNSGLQKVALPDDTFDGVVQNPPFGKESLNFQYKPEINGLSIHNQFALASLDAVKPGGVMGIVVSRYLMDAKDATARRRLADRAELVGAIRLPDSAFKENARTEVVTDMLLFRKFTDAEALERAQAKAEAVKHKAEPEYPAWVNTAEVADPLGGDPITVNAHFQEHPEMVLGVLERSGSMMHRNDVTVRGVGNLQDAIDRAVSALPKDVVNTTPDVIQASHARYQGMANSLRLALSGAEAGEIRFTNDGKLEQIIERETPTGDHELTVRTLTAESPWSPNLYMDADGHWFRLVPKVDENGNNVKKVVKGKTTKLNVYTREVYKTDDDVSTRQRLGKAGIDRLTALAKLRDMLKKQLTLEAEDAPESQLTENRTVLREAYQAYQKKNGYVNEPRSASLVSEMPDGALVLALEHGYRAKTDTRDATAEMAPILTERVLEPYAPPDKASSPADALSISLAESGRIDIDRVATLLGMDKDAATEALTGGDHPLAFHDPETGNLAERHDYLTGNVRRKLDAAKAARLPGNVAALEAVQPEPWGAENVTMHVGANWVPADVYASFIEHMMGGKAHVHYSPLTNAYQVSITGGRANPDFSTGSASTDSLLSDMLNSRSTVIRVRVDENHTVVDEEATALATQARQAIEREFEEWAFNDGDRRKRLVDLFNDKFNVRVKKQWDGSHLELPGKVPDTVIRMRRHQNNAIWRGISQRFMLVDHAVGAGKTFTAIARVMERRRMGLARKPMIVVPNHLVNQWAADVYRLYPGAKVLAAGNKDFSKMRRRRLFANIATGDWDVVIVPHSSFGFIGISPDTEQRYLEAEIARATQAIADAQQDADENPTGGFGKPIGVKEAERLKEKLESRMSKLQSATRDKLLTFEQMGVDDLTVDEAHEFKNLFYSSRLTGVRGMGNKEGSRKAYDLYNKVRVLRGSPTGAVTFLTGTPISNSAVEMYTMMRYLAADELRDMGLENFDAWRSQFVTAEPGFEPTETGSLKEVTRLGRSWANMRSLMELYASFTDSVSNEDIERAYAEDNKDANGNSARFPIPDIVGGGRESVVVEPTRAQAEILEQVIAGFNGLKGISDPKERNKARLRLMDRARKVALDARAAGGDTTDNEAGGKLQVIADSVADTYRKWNADKGTQLIFLDRSVPKSKGDKAIITAYDKLKAQADKALADGDDDEFMALQERLEKYNSNEIEELRAAQNGGWNAYQQLKDNLIERGIPANEIRFVQEASNDAQKKALFDAVNAGEVRVLIGSTPRMGAGTNVQDRLVALHHADVTWKPSDIEQREGRIIRQGNKLLAKYGPDAFQVAIRAYATERTIDAKMWDLNSQKLKTINAIRKYDGEFNMDFEDEDAVGMAEMAALASGDPLLMERVKLKSEIDKLELLERAQKRKRWGLQRRLDDAKRTMEKSPERLEHFRGITKMIESHNAAAVEEHAGRTVTIEGNEYSSLPDATRALRESIESQKAGTKGGKFSVEVGGKRYTNQAGAQEALSAALGDADAFSAKIGGDALTRRKDAANAIAADLGDSRNVDGKRIGEFYGMPLVADVSMTAFGRVATLTITDPQGRTLLSSESNPKQTTGTFIGSEIRPIVNELSRAVRENYAASSVRNIEHDMAQAKAAIPEIEEQLAKPPKGLEELPAKRARLADVVRMLQAKENAGAVNAPQAPDGAANAGVEFSRTQAAPAHGVPVASLQRVADSLTAHWKNAPAEVHVVATGPDLPSFVRNAPGFDATVEAVHASGHVYLVADRLASVDRAKRVLAHEVIGHYTVERILGAKGFAQVRGQIARLRDTGKMPELFAELERRYGKLDDATLASEAMAVMAERGMRNTIIGRVMAAVRRFLRGLGFNVQFSEGDLRQIITDAGRYAEGGRPRALSSASRTVNGVRYSRRDRIISFGTHPYGEPTDITFEPFVNNASGESSASIEAINRLRDEQASGRVRLLIDSNGSVRPLLGVDAVDTFARPGQVIVQSGVGPDAWTPISTDPAMNREMAKRVVARAKSRLDATVAELNGSGPFDADGDTLPGIAWSKRPPQDIAADVERAAKFHIGDIVQTMRDKREDWRPGWLGMLTLRQLAEVSEKYLPGVRGYVDEAQAMQTRRNILTDEAFGQADKWATWARKHREENKTMVGVMHDATLAGVDPAEKFVPGFVKLVSGEVVPMTEDAVNDAIKDLKKRARGAPDSVKQMLQADIDRVEQAFKTEADRVTSYPDLARRYAALPDEAKAIYRDVRDAYKARSEAMQKALVDRIGALEMDEGKRRALADQVRANFEAARVQGPYFPLARFGEYWVSAEKNGEKEFRMMENRAQQRRVLETYKANGWGVTAGAKIDMARAVSGASASFMASVAQTLEANGVDSDVADEVYQLYLRTLPDLSVRKQFIHRKGTPGFDQDALRAFAAQMGHGAYQLARLEHSHRMEKLLTDMRKDVAGREDEASVEAVKAARALTEVNKRHEWVMNPKDASWVQKVTAANFIYYLGTTPAAAFVNLSQGFITTFPAMAAKHGWIKAMSELVKGLRQSIRTMGHVDKLLTGDEARAYKALSEMGAIDKTRAHDLAGMGDGSILSYNPAWRNTMKITSELFHRSEVFNREAAGLAAYRLARKAGETHEAAVEYAANTIFDTHFDYSNANRARFMQSNTAKVIFAFRQYSQHMLYYIWRNFYQSVRGATKQEKAEARRKLVGTLGMTAVFSGVMGLPMMTLAFGVANAFHHMFGDDDEPWDAETEFRNFLVEMLGPEVGHIAQDGPLNAATGLDIASRTSLDQVWFRAPDRELEGRAQYDFWLEQLAGPVGGMFANAFRGAQLIGDGHIQRGWETMLPKMAKDSLKAMRYATQGVNTLRGDPLVKDLSPYELLMQAAGFSPAKVNEQYTLNNAMMNYEKAITDRRQALMNAYAMAVRMRDMDAIRASIAKIKHFNSVNPEVGITAGSIRRSLMARERYSDRTVNGIALNPRLAAKVRAGVRFGSDE